METQPEKDLLPDDNVGEGRTFQHTVVGLLVLRAKSLYKLCRFGSFLQHLHLHAAATAAAQTQL